MAGNYRQDYLSWQEYFMKMAELNAQRSKDPKTQVGACLVDAFNRVLGNGYNGMPRGCPDSEFPWHSPEKHLYVCHAEMNALLNVNNWSLVPGSSLYTTLFPCNECAKMIIQSGVSEVVYKAIKDKPESNQACFRMFRSAGVTLRQFQLEPVVISVSKEPTVDLLAREQQQNPNLFEKILDKVGDRAIWSLVFTVISLDALRRSSIPDSYFHMINKPRY